jgi:hypothetical protein
MPNDDRLGVWAIDERHLHNYLLPRDCPRVTFFNSDSTNDDAAKIALGGTDARAVVAIESAWYDRVRNCKLYIYSLPKEAFEL